MMKENRECTPASQKEEFETSAIGTQISAIVMKEQEVPSSLTNAFESFSPPLQFTILGCGVFLFFGLHNYLQEAMMNIPGFQFGVMLGYMEVLG
jgi:hypothetical protein